MLQQYTSKKILVKEYFQKLTFFEYFYVLVMIIYAGYANTFIRTASIKENLIGIIIPVILSSILAIKRKIKLNTRFFTLIMGLSIYFLAISIKFNQFRPTIFLNYTILFFIVYTTVKALKFNLFRIYEYLLLRLVIIALIIWSIQIMLGGDLLFSLFNKISGIKLFSYVSGDGLNVIFYSVQPFDYNLSNNLGIAIPRNCGFAWEPGAFSVFICLGIFSNLFINNPDKRSKIRFWIFVFGLITTQSTTGFSIFIIIMLFYYFNKKLSILILALPVIVTLTILIFSLPFMSNKIVGLVNETDDLDMIVESSINSEESINPQRFASLMIGFNDFITNPILGIEGGGNEESWTAKIDANISVISGLGSLLAQSGLIGFLFFCILSIKSSFFLSKYRNYNGKFLFFIIIIFISISYTIIFLPLIACFWMFSFFEPQNHQRVNT